MELRLDNYVENVSNEFREEIVRDLCSCNGRGKWEIVLGKELSDIFIQSNLITHIKPYYVMSKIHNVEGTKVAMNLSAACSKECIDSIRMEFKRAKDHKQNIYVCLVVNESCSTFITRRQLGNNKNCDIPFSLHAINGEYIKNGASNIKNKEFIVPYLDMIANETFKTSHIKDIWFMHLKLDGVSHYNLFDNDYIEALQPFNKEILDSLNDSLYIESLRDSNMFSESMIMGFEKQFSKYIINSADYKYDRDYKLELRLSHPVTKPSRLYMLNDYGLNHLDDKVFNTNKKKYILRTRTLVKPTELRMKVEENKDALELSKTLSFKRMLEEGRKHGLSDTETLNRLAVIEHNNLLRVKVDNKYAMEYIK